MASIFTKVINGEIKGTVLYQDEICAALLDIQPVAPKHILVVPRKEIKSTDDATAEDKSILGHCLMVAAEIARKQGLADDGYRLVINTGKHGGQTVDHLHIHVLGGRKFQWPPG